MLVEFSVENYRSFRDRQTLSLVASRDDSLPRNVREIGGTRPLRVLKAAAILGANASGKSNLLRAMEAMQCAVIDAPLGGGTAAALANLSPFRGAEQTGEAATRLEVVVALDSQLYRYGFATDRRQILEEWLEASSLGGERFASRRLFARRGTDLDFGPSWRGDRKKLQAGLLSDHLVLTRAAKLEQQNAHELWSWMLHGILGDWPEGRGRLNDTRQVMRGLEFDDALGRALPWLDLARAADLGIVGMSRRQRPGGRRTARQSADDDERGAVLVTHRTSSGVEFDLDLFEDESDGTRRALALVGQLGEALEPRLMLVDELDSSLHPHLAGMLVAGLCNHTGRSQLVFTTHDATLLDPDLLRRDQVWFTEKRRDGSTELYSLWDIRERKEEVNLMRRYLSGRYGGVPVLGEWSLAEEAAGE